MELDYEGDPAFLTGGIEALLITMGDLVKSVPAEVAPVPNFPIEHIVGPVIAQTNSPTFTTNAIAAHVDAKTGPELIVCAMARL